MDAYNAQHKKLKEIKPAYATRHKYKDPEGSEFL